MSVGSSDSDFNGNLFASPRNTKSKYPYYNGCFAVPTALTTASYPPTLVADSQARLNFELRSIEEGDGNEDGAKHWRTSDSDAGPDNDVTRSNSKADVTRDQKLYETNDWCGAKTTTNDNAQLKARMMKLAEAVDTGLKTSSKHRQLHPYVRNVTLLRT